VNVPDKWRPYHCSDYYRSALAVSGWWDVEGQCWYIEPAERVYEDPVREFLVIGRPGVDGIEWGYRRNCEGLWAHYPIENEFRVIANSVSDLRDGYASGRIIV